MLDVPDLPVMRSLAAQHSPKPLFPLSKRLLSQIISSFEQQVECKVGQILRPSLGEGRLQRGKIRITDRSGSSAIIDLRFAQTVDDVLRAINGNSEVRVSAVAVGDRIKLVDQSGQTTTNLQVQEAGATTTASDLGLGGINVAANEVLGDDVLRLFDDLQLRRLNDGNGVTLRKSVSDLRFLRPICSYGLVKHPTCVASLTRNYQACFNCGNSPALLPHLKTHSKWPSLPHLKTHSKCECKNGGSLRFVCGSVLESMTPARRIGQRWRATRAPLPVSIRMGRAACSALSFAHPVLRKAINSFS